MAESLARIFERQLELQQKSFGVDPLEMSDTAKMDYIQSMALGLVDELHEALAETGWKPWASSNHINEEAFGSELVDVLHFLVNLWLVAGWTADDVERHYLTKAKANAKRQADGYDGVSSKCPICRRDYQDRGVHCTPGVCAA